MNILGIKYSYNPPTVGAFKNAATEDWKKCLVDGNLEPDIALSFEADWSHLNLVILSSTAYSDKAFVVCLATSPFPEDYSLRLYLQNTTLAKELENMSLHDAKVNSLLEETPVFKSFHSDALSTLMISLPDEILKQLKEIGQNVGNFSNDTLQQIEAVATGKVYKILMGIDFDKANLRCAEVEIPAETDVNRKYWPEYEALYRRDKRTKDSLNETNLDILAPKSSSSILTLDASQLLRFFKSNGEPAYKVESGHNKTGHQKSYLMKPYSSLKSAKESGWPDCLLMQHHGIQKHKQKSSLTVGDKNHVPLRRSPRKLPSNVPVLPRRSPRKLAASRANVMMRSPHSGSGLASIGPLKSSSKAPRDLSAIHKQKLRVAIMNALESEHINVDHPLFKVCFRKLFLVCQPFVLDLVGQGSMSKNMQKVAFNHVKQVIDFEKLKLKKE